MPIAAVEPLRQVTASATSSLFSSELCLRAEARAFRIVSNALIFIHPDCPREVSITSSDPLIGIGTRLECQSVSHPPADYRWTVFGADAAVSGDRNSSLTLTSVSSHDGGVIIEVQCMAVNYPQQAYLPCYGSASITMCLDENGLQQNHCIQPLRINGNSFDMSHMVTVE